MEDRSKRKMCETLSRNPILKTWMSSRTTQTQCASNPNTNTHNSSEREREREQIYTQPEIARSFVYFLEREGERKEEKKKDDARFAFPLFSQVTTHKPVSYLTAHTTTRFCASILISRLVMFSRLLYEKTSEPTLQ